MIGFITTQEKATEVNDIAALAQTSRGLPVFWLPGKFQIFAGEHAGSWFIPADEQLMDTPLLGNPPQTPKDFPEFYEVLESLGGLESRVDIDPSCIQPEPE